MNVEEITLESDDRGFELHVLTTDEGRMVFNIHGVAVDLYNEVVKNIGPWISEGLAARAEYDRLRPFDQDAEDSYDLTDPKHPGFLETADLIRDRLRTHRLFAGGK